MSEHPKRIQRKRSKGWRMPEGAVYVGRPTRWGNPFTVMNAHRQGWLVWDDRDRFGLVTFETSNGYIASFKTRAETNAHAVKLYRKWLMSQSPILKSVPELRGKDLVCWCPLGQPCHADVLLELANAGAAS